MFPKNKWHLLAKSKTSNIFAELCIFNLRLHEKFLSQEFFTIVKKYLPAVLIHPITEILNVHTLLQSTVIGRHLDITIFLFFIFELSKNKK